MMNRLSLIALPVLAVTFAGCSNMSLDDQSFEFGPTVAQKPSIISTNTQANAALACIKDTGVLRNTMFAVGAFVDSTGKMNAVAPGATGSFLPQAGSATYVTDALKRAGANVHVTYFGPAAAPPKNIDYAVNGIFNTLDFGSPVNADVRIAGIGPTAQTGWAQLTLTIQMDRAASRVNQQISMIQRPVRYTQLGVGAGKTWGDTLVTGNIQLQDQQRLQFEAVNGPVALGVIDVLLKEFPALEKCREHVVERTAFATKVTPEQPVAVADLK